MTKFHWAAVIAILLGAVGGVKAQPPAPRPLGPVANPPVSPYINLLRPGSSPAINYYGLVRPQVDFQQSMLALQSQVLDVQQGQNSLRNGDPGTTGHSVYFLNYGGYFLNTVGRPAAPGAVGAVGVGNRAGTNVGVPAPASRYGSARPIR